MQIFRRMFKASHDDRPKAAASCRETKRELKGSQCSGEKEVASRDLILYNKGAACRSSYCRFESDEKTNTEKTFTVPLAKDDSQTCFYSTLNLKHLRNIYTNRPHICRTTKNVQEKSPVENCKVLFICNPTMTGLNAVDRYDSKEDDEHKSENRRRVSKMKELLKWAAAAKNHKEGIKGWKIAYFSSKAALKAPPNDELSSNFSKTSSRWDASSSNSSKTSSRWDMSSSNSSKTSSRWDVGSCSTSSSLFSSSTVASASKDDPLWSKSLQNPSVDIPGLNKNDDETDSLKRDKNKRNSQWITTDSNFVVLELDRKEKTSQYDT